DNLTPPLWQCRGLLCCGRQQSMCKRASLYMTEAEGTINQSGSQESIRRGRLLSERPIETKQNRKVADKTVGCIIQVLLLLEAYHHFRVLDVHLKHFVPQRNIGRLNGQQPFDGWNMCDAAALLMIINM